MTQGSLNSSGNQDKKRVHIETWGCQMNVADSEQILSLMQQEDYEITPDPEQADLIVLNTCHIREKARHKVLSRLGILRELKEQHPNLKIAVTGCVAQAEGKSLLKQAPAIDILVGPGKIRQIPQLLREHEKSRTQMMATGFSQQHALAEAEPDAACHEQAVPASLNNRNEISRFVNIQQGCDNFCTFCVVPFTRGREISERPDIIRAKVKALVRHGAKEITLLGQNVNSYGQDLAQSDPDKESPFVRLLQDIASVPGLQRLRFTTSNPHDLTQPLAELFRKEPKLGRYYHLPVQSGSNRILSVMRRKVTAEEYLMRVNWLRDAVPDMAISTDLIVGFPGETEEDFEETLTLMEKVQFSFVYAFMYSPRKGTAAIRFKEQIPEATKAARLARLNQLQDTITQRFHEQEVGKTRAVLFLYESQKERGIWYGRTEHFRLVRVASSENLSGILADVRIHDYNKTALSGELIRS